MSIYPHMQNGQTPINIASQYEHTDTVRLLLENKADPNISNKVSGCYSVLVNCIDNNTYVLYCIHNVYLSPYTVW